MLIYKNEWNGKRMLMMVFEWCPRHGSQSTRESWVSFWWGTEDITSWRLWGVVLQHLSMAFFDSCNIDFQGNRSSGHHWAILGHRDRLLNYCPMRGIAQASLTPTLKVTMVIYYIYTAPFTTVKSFYSEAGNHHQCLVILPFCTKMLATHHCGWPRNYYAN